MELSEHVVAICNFHSVSITLCTVASIHSIQKRTRNLRKLRNKLKDVRRLKNQRERNQVDEWTCPSKKKKDGIQKEKLINIPCESNTKTAIMLVHICRVFSNKLNSWLVRTNNVVTAHSNIIYCVLILYYCTLKKYSMRTKNLVTAHHWYKSYFDIICSLCTKKNLVLTKRYP